MPKPRWTSTSFFIYAGGLIVLGSAVGDALGAPFEFGPEGAFSARFPAGAPAEEMCGGGGWDPGEATDDTQMMEPRPRSTMDLAVA